jgi:NhaP-type Na+/H+ and K+/H+ antiporters
MLTSLALIFICGLLLGSLFKKIGLPPLIGMLITGILLRPFIDVSILNISADLREIALIIILTRAGLSLDVDDLKQIGRPAVMMSFIPACCEMIGTVLISYHLLKLPLIDCAILAAVVASASPAVIVPRMLRLMDEGYGTDKNIPQLILAGDSVDDVFNIVVFTSLLGLTGGESISVMKFVGIPISIVVCILIGVICGLLLSFMFRKIHMRDSVKVILIISIAFLLANLDSGLVSVMAAGVVILRKIPDTAKRISAKFSKLWVAAEVILFVLVGASVNISYAADAGFKTIIMLITVLIFRAGGILLCLIKTNLTWKERLFCTFTGIPKATVQAAIGAIPLSMGLPNGEIILAVAVLSILFTAPFGAFVIDFTYKRLLNHK